MEQKLYPGTIETLKVARESDFGYFLSNGFEDTLLHKREVEKQLSEGEEVEVFLYQDHEGRLAATTSMPFITLDSIAWLDVVGVNRKLGVFLNIGIQKDVLLSRDDLPFSYDQWPAEGDKLYCGLKLDKKNRLFAEFASEEEIIDVSDKAPAEAFNLQTSGRVYKIIDLGAFLLTENNYIGFLHNDEAVRQVRLGEEVACRVTHVREDGRVNVSTKLRKEKAYGEDAEKLLTYLQKAGGKMPFSDQSDPDEIKRTFNISKSAFKRALGKLLKDGLIQQENGVTVLKGTESHK